MASVLYPFSFLYLMLVFYSGNGFELGYFLSEPAFKCNVKSFCNIQIPSLYSKVLLT